MHSTDATAFKLLKKPCNVFWIKGQVSEVSTNLSLLKKHARTRPDFTLYTLPRIIVSYHRFLQLIFSLLTQIHQRDTTLVNNPLSSSFSKQINHIPHIYKQTNSPTVTRKYKKAKENRIFYHLILIPNTKIIKSRNISLYFNPIKGKKN